MVLNDKATPRPWRESWDYRRVNANEDMLHAHACGPQHVTHGVLKAPGLLQPPDDVMERVYADAALIVAAVNAYDAHRALVEVAKRVVAAYYLGEEHKAIDTDLRAALAAVDEAEKPR